MESEEASSWERSARTAYVHNCTYIYVQHCDAHEDSTALVRLNPSRASTRMPFAGPETALEATIVPAVEVRAVRRKITRPAARQGPSTTFQQLTRRLNNLQKMTRSVNFRSGQFLKIASQVSDPLLWFLCVLRVLCGKDFRVAPDHLQERSSLRTTRRRCVPQISQPHAQVVMQRVRHADREAESEQSLGQAECVQVLITPEQSA
jgi:hypothetical protein